MNIHDLIREGENKIFRQETHVASEANQLDISSTQFVDDLRIVFFASSSASFDNYRLNTALARSLEPGRVRFVAYHDSDLRIRDLSALHGIDKRDHVRSTPRD